MAVIKREASRISDKFPVPRNGVRYRIGTHKIKGERRPDTVAMSVDTPRSISSLLEHRPAGIAKVGLLPPQAGGNGPDVRDFAGAQTIDVGRAGLALLRRCKLG